MSKTLLTRISKLEQYNATNKTVLWEDPDESRWKKVYGQLQVSDNAIFIAADKLLIGTVSVIVLNIYSRTSTQSSTMPYPDIGEQDKIAMKKELTNILSR